MSNFIEVDHSKFESAATAIEDYMTLVKNNMSSAGDEVSTMSANWKGDDYTQFLAKWSTIQDEGSVSSNMSKALGAYAEFLRYCSQTYKQAQSNAVNRATNINNIIV